MAIAHQLFRDDYDKPESKYASTRSTLFGKFYERIIAKWLEENRGYELKRWSKGAVNKPRIYWGSISLDDFDFDQETEFVAKVKKSLKSKVSHCTPDGLLQKEGKLYVWEAKNWPRYPEKGPELQIWNYISDNPWVLAKTCTCDKQELEISGFLFSWWELDQAVRARIENRINRIIGASKFEIVPSIDIMNDCISSRYDWYIKIISQEKANVDDFFCHLLGKA